MSLGIPELIVLFLLFGVPLAVVIAAVVLIKVMGERGKRPCPYCAERIEEQARVCRFCGRDVMTLPPPRY